MTDVRPEGDDLAATSADRRNARLYLIGLGLSLVGDSALSLVSGIWVKSDTGSSAAAGLVQACIYVPSLLAPLAGLLVDRMPRQRFLVVVNVCSAFVVAVLLLVTDPGRIWLIYPVMVGYGVSLVLVGPAESALFAHMLPTAVRRRVNGWRLGMQEMGRLVAPLLGAALFTSLGGPAVAALDAVTFVAAAAATALLRPPSEPPPPPRQRWRTEMGAGIAHTRATPALARIVGTAAMIMAVSGLGVSAQYSLVEGLGKSPGYLGVLTAVLGAGSVVASLVSSRIIGRLGLIPVELCGLGAYAVGSLLRVFDSSAAAIAGSFVLGFALPWVFLVTLSAAQDMTPTWLQGRVNAVVIFLLFAPQAPLQAVGAFLIAHFSYQAIYAASASAAAVLMVYTYIADSRIKRVRNDS
ncbi:MAG: hypothetical protein V7637_1938 [Mycobacteriales bacterium]|jgi:MFS family permease